MDTFTNIFIIAIAIILASSRFAFSRVKKRDRENGLYLPDHNYTFLGTARLMFMKEEKREQREMQKTYGETVNENAELKKWHIVSGLAYCGLLALSSVILGLCYGMNILIIMNLAFVVVGISYLLNKSFVLVVSMLIYGLYCIVSGIFFTTPLQLIPGLAGIAMFIVVLFLRKKAKSKETPTETGVTAA